MSQILLPILPDTRQSIPLLQKMFIVEWDGRQVGLNFSLDCPYKMLFQKSLRENKTANTEELLTLLHSALLLPAPK